MILINFLENVSATTVKFEWTLTFLFRKVVLCTGVKMAMKTAASTLDQHFLDEVLYIAIFTNYDTKRIKKYSKILHKSFL